CILFETRFLHLNPVDFSNASNKLIRRQDSWLGPSTDLSEMNHRSCPQNVSPFLSRHFSRRTILRQLALLSAATPLTAISEPAFPPFQKPQLEKSPLNQPPLQPSSFLSAEDDAFLNDLEHANFLFFWEQANPQTGLIKDRCNVRTTDNSLAASI